MPHIAISGASGLIGGGLVPLLVRAGHSVVRLVRGKAEKGEIAWNPARGEIDAQALEGVDAVIHLSGANISAGRFTQARKREILDSRVKSTALIAETLSRLERKPTTLVCASAIGFYGNRGHEHLDETSPKGQGFLADVVSAWEAAADPARAAGLRVCHVRVGVVLSAEGGALKELRLPFSMGLGGRLGDGKQIWSWIDYDDVLRVFHACLSMPTLSGPVNATAPVPASNADFTKALGRVLRRPTLLPLPAAAIRALFGEMGQTLLLEGARVLPTKLEANGFEFLYPTLESSLRHALGR